MITFKFMKYNSLSVALLMFLGTALFAQQPPHWRDLETIQINREIPSTEFISYPNYENALSMKFEQSPYYCSLNGVWKFLYNEDARNIPDGVEKGEYDVSGWNDIKVPGNWERQGYGTAVYVNLPYDFAMKNPTPPTLPEAVPMGVYRRTFSLPQGWSGRNIYLNIAGAKSGVNIFVNGEEVGYNEDSKDIAVFNITKYLKGEGQENTLTMKISRLSTGSWLECQDFWRISGIERDVFLSSKAKVSLKDFEVVSTLDDTYSDGLFSLSVTVENDNRAEAYVSYSLLDDAGNIVAEGDASAIVPFATFDATLKGVRKWSAEDPYLYKLIIAVKAGGKTEFVPFKVGFRKFEMNGSEFLVNGKAVKFKGVNLHEHDEYTGHYVTEELLIKDLTLMRMNNVNTIRTCHYPQQRRFYELCDEYGIYVWSEANIESHGMGYNLSKNHTLGNDRRFYPMHKDRIVNMYERTKNYPCVTILSLGNEAGNGYNFYKAYEWLEMRDHGEGRMNRPICYERALLEWNTDMYVPMYPSAAWLLKKGREGTDRPVVLCEYSHAMGNSNGGISKMWNYINSFDNLQGGCIWDWVDQGFREETKDGKPFWAYGGDYGVNPPSDANFCCNGLVNPDRTAHPALAEVKYAYSNIGFEALGEDCYNIINRFYFTSLSKFVITYFIKEDGKVIKKGTLNVSTAPQSETTVTIPSDGVKFREGKCYYIDFSATLAKAERLLPAGYEVAHDQFALKLPAAVSLPKLKNGTALQLSQSESEFVISSSKVRFSVDKRSGFVTSLKYGSKEIFKDGFGIRPNFWRASTDNDYGNGDFKRLALWKEASNEPWNKVAAVVDAELKGSIAVISVQYVLSTGNTLGVEYRISSNGMVHTSLVFEGVNSKIPELPRLGVRFRLPVSMDSFSYFGKGPQENYCDRNKGSFVDLYRSKASEEGFAYIRPQENGHHTDTRFISFDGFSIIADSEMEFNILRNSIEDFDLGQQKHISDVSMRDFVEVCLDYRQMGVGGYDSWGSHPDSEALIPATQNYHWGFSIVP